MRQLLLSLFMLMSAVTTNAATINLADPYILKHDGQYYLYGTFDENPSQGIPVYRSKDLVHWQGPLGVHPGGVVLRPGDAFGREHFWNGDVVYANGRFVLHYTAQEQLGVAYAPTPLGPFANADKEPMHRDIKEIDSDLFVDDDGRAYFYFVRFDKGNVIHVARLNDALSHMDDTSLTEVLRADPQQAPWEHTDKKSNWPVIEAGNVVKRKGLYYLFYTANDFRNPDYAIGVATASHPLGPWTRYAGNPILKSQGAFKGTGSGQVLQGYDGRWYIVFHVHASANEWRPRRTAIVQARWQQDPAGGPDMLRPVGVPRVLALTPRPTGKPR